MYAFPLDLAIFCGQIEPIGEMHHSSDLAAPAISIFQFFVIVNFLFVAWYFGTLPTKRRAAAIRSLFVSRGGKIINYVPKINDRIYY
jgi:hypothetical protein